MPWLYHKYAGHDINRDAFMMNLAENRSIADFFYRRWHPQVFLTMHQMGPRGPRFFVPPNTDPIDRNYDPLIWRTAGLLGNAMALALEQDGRAGVLQNALYDYYWPGYEDSAPLGHNTVTPAHRSGERAHRLADHGCRRSTRRRPRAFPITSRRRRSRTRGRAAAGRCATSSTTTSSAARGLHRRRGALPRRPACATSIAWRKRQVELGTKGGPFAFIIPPDQFDAHAARKLEQLLIDGAVEVRRTLEPFRVAETVYPEGADIILMAQPFRAYAKTLLEVQQYPVAAQSPAGRSIGPTTSPAGRCRCR